MPTDEQMEQRAGSFGQVADPYERLRPQYPAKLFDEVLAAAGGRTKVGTLEVGAGGGRATLPLAHRGVDVVALEPSVGMADILRARLHAETPSGRVTIRQQRFDDLVAADGPFGVVVAAQSFHWADPSTRWPRLASLLTTDGLAFIFWNEWAIDPQSHDVEAIQAVYQRVGAGLVPDLDDGRGRRNWADDEIAIEPTLTPALESVFEWGMTLRRDDYLGLLGTTSQYVVAPAAKIQALFDSLGPLLGEQVALVGRTVLLTTRRKSPR
ncbi:MAG TPA: class I SAM-dependent methyltransferase [Marmoricola sp.]|nr:class I SAM-dependent methyltransferase [Marmoricola sp.]